MRIAAALLALVLAGCTSGFLLNPPGESSIRDGLYFNQTYGISVHFPDSGSWWFLTTASDIAQCGHQLAILCAGNPARLLNFVMTLEDGGYEMENEDYQASIENQVRAGWGDKLENSSAKAVRARRGEAWVWTYTLDGDVLTQAFFKRGTQNLRLIFVVPENAWERRHKEISSIIRSVELSEPSLPASAARSL